mmetsp:Transcript_27099/g.65769  ORF Transcript_27099/g.65769 Transcript_27099/m.65769 type:complete len:179 (-) Transcript_27099:246-782(-)|eukprot:CAMPEP_0113629508 /NCGR_PEP_ID=MMETSP0017_2-20120614/15317_1 /TAXON_ID=2856 /ORGANISM="Cylindrotheca closterium" /LENGTH=178 /DNA_ID=CAMNT_0000539907 /DNA_START=16 /DNA_END=552 /DNA_ORIENTATION=+ /assembly_acc=CAM_ASM_000147
MFSHYFTRPTLPRHLAPLITAGAYVVSSSNNSKKATTKLDYYEHDESEFDYYVKNPTVEDLPVLLRKFDDENQDVWPWIWTHPNRDNGPHYVFIGMNAKTIGRIQEIRRQSLNHNLLVIASQEVLEEAAREAGVSFDVYHDCHCGMVTDAELQLLHVKSKILMLDDERVIAFDYLTIC